MGFLQETSSYIEQMELAWLGRYRNCVEALIHYCNIYAAVYKTDKMEYRGIRYSYSKIQVLEYLLEIAHP